MSTEREVPLVQSDPKIISLDIQPRLMELLQPTPTKLSSPPTAQCT